jgi:hypothetical protein
MPAEPMPSSLLNFLNVKEQNLNFLNVKEQKRVREAGAKAQATIISVVY